MTVSVYEFEIQGNEYLKENCIGYYSMDFKSVRQGGELTFLHTLKNNKSNVELAYLVKAELEAMWHIANFLVAYDKVFGNKIREQILVCRVPRSKTYFNESQLYFQKAIKKAIQPANHSINNKLIDGIDYIRRIKDVATTHLANSQLAQATLPKLCSGDKPYPGITRNSCLISKKVANRTILLIDDIYTLGVGVVEDCIQALYDKGAKKVIFYAVGRTNKWGNMPSRKIDVDLENFFNQYYETKMKIDSELFFKGIDNKCLTISDMLLKE